MKNLKQNKASKMNTISKQGKVAAKQQAVKEAWNGVIVDEENISCEELTIQSLTSAPEYNRCFDNYTDSAQKLVF